MMADWKQTATITKTAERCKAEGLGVTEWAIRAWCREGKLRHVMAGKKALIYWPNLIAFLEGGEEDRETAPYGTITPIPEKLPAREAVEH